MLTGWTKITGELRTVSGFQISCRHQDLPHAPNTLPPTSINPGQQPWLPTTQVHSRGISQSFASPPPATMASASWPHPHPLRVPSRVLPSSLLAHATPDERTHTYVPGCPDAAGAPPGPGSVPTTPPVCGGLAMWVGPPICEVGGMVAVLDHNMSAQSRGFGGRTKLTQRPRSGARSSSRSSSCTRRMHPAGHEC